MFHACFAISAVIYAMALIEQLVVAVLAGIDVVEHLVIVIYVEDSGDIYAEGAVHAITAAGAWNQRLGVNRGHDILYGLLFGLIQRLHLVEGGKILLHLLQIGHTTQNDGDIILRGDKTQCPFSIGGAGTCLAERSGNIGSQIGQGAAADRFHNNNRNAGLGRDII